MPSVTDRFAKPFVLGALQCVDKGQHTLKVEYRVLPRDGLWQRRPRLRGRQPFGRGRDDHAQFIRPWPAERYRVARVVVQDRRQTSKQRRRGVVGMTLEGCGYAEQYTVGYRPAHVLEDPKSR